MGYWKRSVGLVIGFGYKYRSDPFFRTEVNIVLLQAIFALFLLAVVGVVASQLYHDASAAVSAGVVEALSPNSSPASVGESIISEIMSMRVRTMWIAAGVIVLITAGFTYVVARLALAPVRNALESQKRFIGNIAHELRTPLSIIKTNTEVKLLASDVGDEVRAQHQGTIEELDRISDIINNLLSLSASIRPERLEFRDVDLGEVVRGVIHKMKDLAEQKRLEIEIRTSERRNVWANGVALEQIVMNVIKNSILYTSRGGRILVIVEPVYPDFVELRVQDSGSGIARKDLFHIFEPFYRADPSRKRNGSGSGLGLTIVSELVKLHNGKITVRSAEGQGTTVGVLLPAGKSGVGVVEPTEGLRDNVSEITADFSHR